MSKRLGKDQRNKFLAEFEQNGKLDSTEYYARKDKNGKIQIRRIKEKKSSSESSGDLPKEPKQVAKEEPKESAAEAPKKEPKEKTL